MWRTFFITIGILFVLLGAEFLIVDRAIWRNPNPSANQVVIQRPTTYNAGSPTLFQRLRAKSNNNPNEFEPADWVPWALLSCGTIIILYSLTIPRRGAIEE